MSYLSNYNNLQAYLALKTIGLVVYIVHTHAYGYQ